MATDDLTLEKDELGDVIAELHQEFKKIRERLDIIGDNLDETNKILTDKP